MPLLTTTIGSYPKPAYAPVANGFDDGGGWRRTATPAEYLAATTERALAELDRATREVVAEQCALGVDVPTDGEVRREHYIYYHCRHLGGFDFTALTEKTMRGSGWTADVPTVTRRIRAGAPFLPRDWKVAQDAAGRPVKMTVPGPLTILASSTDAFYGDERREAADLAAALNVELRRLADAGCTWIQVDEPVFAREPGRALELGVDLLARCFHGLPPEVRRVVHVCCGYPAALDQDDYPKADPRSYFALADALDAAPVDAVSIEDAHRHNDLRLLERFSRTSVLLGSVDVARTRVESIEEIRERLRKALDHIDAARLMATPDCGLAMLGRELAAAKLRHLVAAARSLE